MALFISLLLFLGFSSLLLQIHTSLALTCTSQKFTPNRLYDHCSDLPHLSSYLHWTFDPTKSSLNLAFIAPPAKPSGWVAWAINPKRAGMIGAQALIGFKQDDGSMTVKTFNLESYKSVKQAKIAYKVSSTEAEYEDGVMTIFATIALPENMTTLNQVWQVGSAVVNGTPAMHEFTQANLNSKGVLDLLEEKSSGKNGGDSKILRDKNIHGVLNTVSWGIMFPIGIMMARYLRTFTFADPAWFYLHVACQFSSYVIGVAGWAMGLKLGSQSKGVEYTSHRYLGIALFCLATLQVFALFLRPKKDHKYRFYWNIYHHGVGYSVLVLGIINVFKGLKMLDPAKEWKVAYIILLTGLGMIALVLEIITWVMVLKRKSRQSTKPYDGFEDSNGRQQPLAS